jgi:hypothetical protein
MAATDPTKDLTILDLVQKAPTKRFAVGCFE